MKSCIQIMQLQMVSDVAIIIITGHNQIIFETLANQVSKFQHKNKLYI